jgi:hypothetical protein
MSSERQPRALHIAVLDDYQDVALASADWSGLPLGSEVRVRDRGDLPHLLQSCGRGHPCLRAWHPDQSGGREGLGCRPAPHHGGNHIAVHLSAGAVSLHQGAHRFVEGLGRIGAHALT